MEYLADKITDTEIDKFEQEKYIIINSPTGSGKTTFVLKKLLSRAFAKGKHIVYICNRRILRDQIEVSAKESKDLIFGSLTTLGEQESDFIHIFTYQYCEAQGCLNKIRVPDTDTILCPENVAYYIFDEAHYFLNDSLFNQGTHYWTEKQRFSEIGIKIFITATPEPLFWFLSATIPWNRRWYDKEMRSLYIPYLYQMICDKVEEKGGLKTDLKTALEVQVSFNKDGSLREANTVRSNSSRDVSDKCKMIKIFAEALETMQEQINIVQLYYNVFPRTAFNNNYNQLIEFYYISDEELLPAIEETPDTEKWLIFVSDSAQGYTLESKLHSLGIDVVFLSRRTVTKEADVKSQYNQIVEKGMFSCQVLIATSVMDCGVSITDTAVKHIAVSQSDKVTFLQMLGRRRLADEESVCLYIKAFNIKQINGIKHKYEEKAILMSQFGLINDPRVWFQKPTENDDGMRFRDHFGKDKVNRICNDIAQAANHSLTYIVSGKSKQDSSAEVTEVRTNNITAFIALLYVISELTAAVEDYDASEDPFFYLKRQLNWIGKVYDERRWLTLRVNMGELNALLEKYLDKMLNKEEQREFSLEFLESAMSLPNPPKVFKVNRSRYKEQTDKPQKGPGLNRINKALEEIGLPYYVDTKCWKRKTVWIVTRKERQDDASV